MPVWSLHLVKKHWAIHHKIGALASGLDLEARTGGSAHTRP